MPLTIDPYRAKGQKKGGDRVCLRKRLPKRCSIEALYFKRSDLQRILFVIFYPFFFIDLKKNFTFVTASVSFYY